MLCNAPFQYIFNFEVTLKKKKEKGVVGGIDSPEMTVNYLCPSVVFTLSQCGLTCDTLCSRRSALW